MPVRMKISSRPVEPQPLAGRKIVLDPGHGGDDPGAIGAGLGVQEKDVNLDVALKLRDGLVALGAQVRMTRDADVSVAPPGSSKKQELQARVDVANRWPADLYVSVHSNSFVRADKDGTECYHARQASPHSRILAAMTHEALVERTGLTDSGVRAADFYVIKNTTMPATLVELAYLSNPEDEKRLGDPGFRTTLAGALTQGVQNYFQAAQALDEQGVRHVPPPNDGFSEEFGTRSSSRPEEEFLLVG